MLELVEIFDGFFLLLAYLTLTLFIPVAFVGVAAGVGARLAGRLFGAAARVVRLEPERDLSRGARHARFLLVTLPSWLVGIVALLAAIALMGGRASADPAAVIGEGARLMVGVLARIQDGSMLAWTGNDLESVLARTAADDGLRPLGTFAALVAARTYELVRPELSLDAFRWLFALGVSAIVLVAGGLSPLRLLSARWWFGRRPFE